MHVHGDALAFCSAAVIPSFLTGRISSKMKKSLEFPVPQHTNRASFQSRIGCISAQSRTTGNSPRLSMQIGCLRWYMSTIRGIYTPRVDDSVSSFQIQLHCLSLVIGTVSLDDRVSTFSNGIKRGYRSRRTFSTSPNSKLLRGNSTEVFPSLS